MTFVITRYSSVEDFISQQWSDDHSSVLEMYDYKTRHVEKQVKLFLSCLFFVAEFQREKCSHLKATSYFWGEKIYTQWGIYCVQIYISSQFSHWLRDVNIFMNKPDVMLLTSF